VAAEAVQLTLGKNGAIERAGIGLTNAGLTPIEAVDARNISSGRCRTKKPSPSRAAAAVKSSRAGTAAHGRIQEGNGPRSDDTRAAQSGAARRETDHGDAQGSA